MGVLLKVQIVMLLVALVSMPLVELIAMLLVVLVVMSQVLLQLVILVLPLIKPRVSVIMTLKPKLDKSLSQVLLLTCIRQNLHWVVLGQGKEVG
jgi:hypothetical protein